MKSDDSRNPFVLVHGSSGGSWVWNRITPLLRAAGHGDWINERMTPHPVSTYTEPVPPGNEWSRALPRVFVHCAGNPPTTPDVFGPFAKLATAKGWEVYELVAGHLAMLTDPDDLAMLLMYRANPLV
jgi:hypothetical protein